MDVKKTLAELKKDLKTDPKSVYILKSIANIYFHELGNKEKALKFYEKALKYSEDDVENILKKIEEIKKG